MTNDIIKLREPFWGAGKKYGWNKDISDLVAKGILEYDGRDLTTNIKDYVISQMFLDEFFLDIDKAGQEFYDAYPSYIDIDGRKILAKKGDKDALIAKYCKDINYDKEMHNKILLALPIAEKQGSLNMAIRNFIESGLYKDIVGLLDKPNEDVEFRESI